MRLESRRWYPTGFDRQGHARSHLEIDISKESDEAHVRLIRPTLRGSWSAGVLARRNRTRMVILVLGLCALVFIPILGLYNAIYQRVSIGFEEVMNRYWPLYHEARVYEHNLPQHRWEDIANKTARINDGQKFIRFPDGSWGRGLNNILQEVIMGAHVAYLSNRSFVFEDYVWSQSRMAYTPYESGTRPTRAPLTAYISGYSAGGCPVSDQSIPCAVSAEYFEATCPKEEQLVIYTPKVDKPVAKEVAAWWMDRLAMPDIHSVRCLVVMNFADHHFNPMFDTPRIISILPELEASPVLKDFAWSALVHSSLAKSLPAFTKALEGTSVSGPKHKTQSPEGTIPGLVALHVRRGDYKQHCKFLASRKALYVGFSGMPGMRDTFNPERWAEEASSFDEYYQLHCFPTIGQIIARLRTIRKEHAHEHGGEPLSRVFLLTNAPPPFLAALTQAMHMDGWGSIFSSEDLNQFLDKAERSVSVATDMALATEKAEVFVGNGFSTVSSNIHVLRKSKGHPLSKTRFL